ncbi:aldo/keto reductase [Candidatus Bathyarchaeota archaeon]|nr:aldo/keto reductase [Candidatus Bathyarchaeota archaeon]
MKFRRFGKLDWKASVLGFGVMRLPLLDNDSANIDEPEAIRMIQYAINHGVNYLDTAYPYHGGNSEVLLGKALKDGYRDRVKLATKMPTWLVNSQLDMDKYLNEQLARLQTDHIDFYLLHGLKSERWQKMRELGVLTWAERTLDTGKIRHLGFSFHDEYDVFKEIIDSYENWTLCQIQYNYFDADYQAGTRGLKYAASKGLAVVVMEPIAGGKLALPPITEIQAIWDQSETKRTPAEWALHWVWNHPEVSITLSGMSTMQQVIENIESAERSGPNTLAPKELKLIEQVKQKYSQLGLVGCTDCQYCMPCPEGVAIPQIFQLYNEYYMRGRDVAVKNKYEEQVSPESRPEKCVNCGRCEELCPQQLPIQTLLRRAGRSLDPNR